METPHTNIEIKALCSDHNKVRDFLKSHKADFKGIDHQIDTYFKVNNGRLKLREGNVENNLIYYERENKQGPKQCNFTLFKSSPESSLKSILLNSCGILTVVDKKREIYFIENVKFHLDTVLGLGTFMEIEAIDTSGHMGQEKLLEQCNNFLKELNILDSDLISVSYSDLLLKKASEQSG